MGYKFKLREVASWRWYYKKQVNCFDIPDGAGEGVRIYRQGYPRDSGDLGLSYLFQIRYPWDNLWMSQGVLVQSYPVILKESLDNPWLFHGISAQFLPDDPNYIPRHSWMSHWIIQEISTR